MIGHFLVESSLLLVLAWIAQIRLTDPARRAALGFAAVLALPLLLLTEGLGLGWHPFNVLMSSRGDTMTVAAADWTWPLMAIHAGVSGLLLIRWLGSLWQAHRLRRQSIPCADRACNAINLSLARTVQRAPPRLRVLATSGSPCLVGGRRPIIYLPIDLIDSDSTRIEQILRHEYAHLDASDWLRTQCVELIFCLFWFQPLLYLACQRFRGDIELACDDQVLRAGGDAVAYVETLSHCARRRAGPMAQPALAMAGQAALLLRRARHILSTDTRPQAATGPLPMALLLGCGVFMSGMSLTPRIVQPVPLPVVATTPIDTLVSPSAAPELSRAPPVPAPPMPMARVPESAPIVRAREPSPLAGKVVEGAAEPASSRSLWQSISVLAIADARDYAAQNSAHDYSAEGKDPRFEAGVRKAQTERGARRERIMRRTVWPLLGTVPL